MKKIIILVSMITLVSCQTKTELAPLQSNGLNYKFIDYIGPDSCKLYECAYLAPGEKIAGTVFLTICKEKQTTTNWAIKSGKQTVYLSNSLAFDTVIKMVPETTLVKRNK